jgi:hypothetical protein
VGLEDEICLPGDPDTIGNEMVRKDGRIQLIIGLVSLPLVDMGQRLTVRRGRLGRGDLRARDLSLGSIGQRGPGWQARQAKKHGRNRQPKAHQNPAKK